MSETKTDWPNEVLVHTRQMGLTCNGLEVTIRSLAQGRPTLAKLHTARAGAPETITACDDWGRVMAYMLALIKLGVPPQLVLNALKAVPR